MHLKYLVYDKNTYLYIDTTIIVIITAINIALIFFWLWMFGAQFSNLILIPSKQMSVYSCTDLHILFSFSQTHWNMTSSYPTFLNVW